MMFYGRSFLFAALSCGLVFVPAGALRAQQSGGYFRTICTNPDAKTKKPDPLKRQRSDEDVRRLKRQ